MDRPSPPPGATGGAAAPGPATPEGSRPDQPQDAVPPPAPALHAAVRDARRVTPRRPARTLALLVAVATVAPAASLLGGGLREDLTFLPALWVAGGAAIWAAAGGLLFARAVLPRRGDVLPDPARALRVALVVSLFLVAFGLWVTVDAPRPADGGGSFAAAWAHCTGLSVSFTLPLLLVAAGALRRLHPLGGPLIAATVGAAGGAVAGLALHFGCPVGGGLHVGLSHGGAVALNAILAAAILSWAVRS